MFLENEYARPLFDTKDGGLPKAYQCLMPHKVLSSNPPFGRMVECKCGLTCDKICRTERGMRSHLKQVHKWEEQPCLYSTEYPSEQNSALRELRVSQPRSPKEKSEPNPLQQQNQRKSAETNEGELLKLMKGGN